MYCWSIIRLRRRVLFEAALLGALVASLIISNIRPVYSSRAIIRDKGVDANGVITNGWGRQENSPSAGRDWY
jgi:hypothetical protein